MTNKEHYLSFFDTELTTSQPARNKLLLAIKREDTPDTLKVASDIFLSQLQKEADEKFKGLEKYTWHAYHLTLMYVEAKLWEDAMEAVNDLQETAINLNQSHHKFDKLEDLINQNSSINY